MQFEIEDGIPLPGPRSGGSPANKKYPFADMEPGQSVCIEDTETARKARPAARVYANRTGKKFRSESIGTGVRIWRVE